MSAEGKKKRGEAGVSNARNIPFRYHGYPKGYSLSTALGRSDHPCFGGSRFLVAMIWGRKLPGFAASDRMYRAADNAIDRCERHGRNPRTAMAEAAE